VEKQADSYDEYKYHAKIQKTGTEAPCYYLVGTNPRHECY